jgi:hypothetical protein
MKWAFVSLVIIASMACTPPATIRLDLAPAPGPQEAARLRESQTRILPVSQPEGFPIFLNALMDHGYVIRSASLESGVIAFFQQWRDGDQGGAIIIHEGTLLATPAGPKSAKVRVILTGSSQRLLATPVGMGGPTVATVGDVQQRSALEDSRTVLDLLEASLPK